MMNDLPKWLTDYNRMQESLSGTMGALDAVTRGVRGNAYMNALDVAMNKSIGTGMIDTPQWLTNYNRIQESLSGTMSVLDAVTRGLKNIDDINKRTSVLDAIIAKQSDLFPSTLMGIMDTVQKNQAFLKGAEDNFGWNKLSQIQNFVGLHGDEYSSYNRLFNKIAQINNIESPSWLYPEIASAISFSGFANEFPDVSNDDFEAVNELINKSDELKNVFVSIITEGSEIISGVSDNEEVAKKFDDWFNENLYLRVFKIAGFTKQQSYLIAYVILTLILIVVKKPIENFVWGDSSKKIISLEEKEISKSEAIQSTLYETNSKVDKLASHIDSSGYFYGTTNQNCKVYAQNNVKSDMIYQLHLNTNVAIVHEIKKWYKIDVTIDSKHISGFILKNKVTVQ